jgi:hypothetical protein
MSKENTVLIACLELTVVVARDAPKVGPYRIARAIHDLQQIGRQLHRRYEASCSYQWADTDAYELRTERLQKKAFLIAGEAGFSIEHQTDPRGWPIIVKTSQGDFRIGGGA